ncbi:MAG TPA: spore coat associated protein CotJA [Herbinix luporum]|nr:spore coat associated protein CotJA [Herbinix luporum]
MCYVPWQCFRDLYENEFVALENGTLFKELDKDWYGRGCK